MYRMPISKQYWKITKAECKSWEYLAEHIPLLHFQFLKTALTTTLEINWISPPVIYSNLKYKYLLHILLLIDYYMWRINFCIHYWIFYLADENTAWKSHQNFGKKGINNPIVLRIFFKLNLYMPYWCTMNYDCMELIFLKMV